MTNIDFYYNEIWKRTLQSVYDTDKIDHDAFDLYLSGSKLVELDEEEAIVIVSGFIHFSIMTQYKSLFEEHFKEQVNGKFIPITIYTERDWITKKKTRNGEIDVPILKNIFDREIDINQNFGNFVLGKSNIQAQVAALTCANNLGLVYNPLFIYGNSGLGKTHLLNSVGNLVTTNFTNKRIGFISGLGFIEALAKSKKDDCIDEFKQSFYNLDLLLVDDIQFIAGKSWTQEVFFSIFSYLVNNKKQVCITADRTPDDIKGMEERIISRFNQGLNVNIESPEYETSIKILEMKLANNVAVKDKVDDEVLSYIATNFSQDVRSLEGAINRLLFYFINFNFDNEDHITLKLASEAFKGQVVENKNELSITKVRKVVCDYYNLSKQQIQSANRTKNIAIPRHIAMYLCRKLLDAPYKEIGNEFGKRDHSTVISACEKVEELIKKDPAYLKAINDIEKRLN
ncbi:MAG: chromosomal replication initiator protein DnaA [Erysipelotrichaceae bacterium]|nr:chromosomal replication initiator protein DnaA [Erysipelotrichaceae bacterium]